MSETAHLRTVITGLLGLAVTEEEVLLANANGDVEEPGNEQKWAAVPTVAHNTEFKAQQVERLTAVLAGRTPPAYGDIDHSSAQVYAAYAARPVYAVTADSRQTTMALLDGMRALTDRTSLRSARLANWPRSSPAETRSGASEIRRDVLLSGLCEADCPAGSPPASAPHSTDGHGCWTT